MIILHFRLKPQFIYELFHINFTSVVSLITTLKFEEDFFCRGLNSIKFVLVKFKESLFARNHFDSLVNSQFRVLIKKSGSLCEMNKFVSSANRIDSRFESLFKSFMYRIKNSGPKIDPCGTPQQILWGVDLRPLYSTN